MRGPIVAPLVIPDYLRPASGHDRPRIPGVVRGYVVKVYAPDDPDAGLPAQDRHTGWLCDVHVTEPGFRGILRYVPVASETAGVWDVSHWRPRAATIKVGGSLTDDEGQATPMHDRDGDLVLVAFMGGDPLKPVIVGCLAHPRAIHGVTKDADPKARLERWVAGIRILVDDEGTATIDLTESSKPVPQADGSETGGTGKLVVVSGNGTVTFEKDGPFTVEHAGGKSLTYDSGKLTVNGGGSVQPVLLDAMRADLSTMLTEWFPVIQTLAGILGITLPNSPGIIAGLATGTGPSGTYKAQNAESD